MTPEGHVAPAIERIPFTFDRPLDPVGDRLVWVDRSEELQRVSRHLEKGRWVALFGEAGSGRTSFLHWAADRFLLPGGKPIALQIHLPAVQPGGPIPAVHQFIELLVSEVRGQPILDITTQNHLTQFIRNIPIPATFSAVGDVVFALARYCHSGPVLLILDDGDLAAEEVGKPLFRGLRAQRVKDPRGDRLGVIVCGEKPGSWMGDPRGPGSPLCNILADAYMDEFTVAQIRDLATKGGEGLGISVEHQAIDAVLRMTQGVPAVIQRILYQAFDYAQRHNTGTITCDLVEAVAAWCGIREAPAPAAAIPSSAEDSVARFESAVQRLERAMESALVSDPLRTILEGMRGGPPREGVTVEQGLPGERFYHSKEATIRAEFAGKWIAVTSKGVIAHQEDGEELAEQMREMDLGGEVPFVVKVEVQEQGEPS